MGQLGDDDGVLTKNPGDECWLFHRWLAVLVYNFGNIAICTSTDEMKCTWKLRDFIGQCNCNHLTNSISNYPVIISVTIIISTKRKTVLRRGTSKTRHPKAIPKSLLFTHHRLQRDPWAQSAKTNNGPKTNCRNPTETMKSAKENREIVALLLQIHCLWHRRSLVLYWHILHLIWLRELSNSPSYPLSSTYPWSPLPLFSIL